MQLHKGYNAIHPKKLTVQLMGHYIQWTEDPRTGEPRIQGSSAVT